MPLKRRRFLEGTAFRTRLRKIYRETLAQDAEKRREVLLKDLAWAEAQLKALYAFRMVTVGGRRGWSLVARRVGEWAQSWEEERLEILEEILREEYGEYLRQTLRGESESKKH